MMKNLFIKVKKSLLFFTITFFLFIVAFNISYGQPAAGRGESKSLIYFFFMAYIGGLILNLMPCVLPVISLKVFGLISAVGEEKSKVFKAGMAFTGGVLFTFTILAAAVAILKTLGEQVGWGFQFQSPYFVMGLMFIIYIFALSLFELFEIAPPRAEKIDKLAQEGGLGGSFFEGILAVLLATPCSAPFLGTALAFAFSQPAWVIFVIFLTIGLGLSTPYLILTANPDWMKFLPKPGNWMIKLRTAMGFLLMGTVCWLLWVLGKQTGAEAVVATVAFLIFIASSIWITTFIEYKTSSMMRWIIRLIALLLLASGFFVSYMWLYPWQNFNSSASPAPIENGEVKEGKEVNGVLWRNYTPSSFEEARKTGKIIFLDITADWCLTCKTNENTILYSDEISKRLGKDDIIVFNADNTKRSDEVTGLMKSLERSAVPVYAIYPPGEESEPVLLPEVITKSMVLEAIEKASR